MMTVLVILAFAFVLGVVFLGGVVNALANDEQDCG